jgi:hypothetical protein
MISIPTQSQRRVCVGATAPWRTAPRLAILFRRENTWVRWAPASCQSHAALFASRCAIALLALTQVFWPMTKHRQCAFAEHWLCLQHKGARIPRATPAGKEIGFNPEITGCAFAAIDRRCLQQSSAQRFCLDRQRAAKSLLSSRPGSSAQNQKKTSHSGSWRRSK